MILPSTHYPIILRHLAVLLVYPFKSHFQTDLNLHFRHMESFLTDSKPWFSGAKHGLADFCMSFPMDLAWQRGYFDVTGEGFPRLKGWLGRVHGLSAYQRALEKGGKYDLVNS